MKKSPKAIFRRDKADINTRTVRDIIPINCIWNDGIFACENVFTKTFRFSDINYMVASREAKESMFLTYSNLLNSLDCGATAKLTIFNRRVCRPDYEAALFMPMKGDESDKYRRECNDIIMGGKTNANGYRQGKVHTYLVAKKDVSAAAQLFCPHRLDLSAHFAAP